MISSNAKRIIKKLVPDSLLKLRGNRIVAKQQQYFETKSVAETFTEIYQRNLWGENGDFYSGPGSDEKYAEKYKEIVHQVIAENNIKSVVDLGCGDFKIGSNLVAPHFHYTGVDVVPMLIEHLQDTKKSSQVDFACLNIIEDKLPPGDLCLIRQVLQHLSNEEIARLLENCRQYKFLLVTEEHLNSSDEIVPNVDIVHSPITRVYYNSAVYLDQPPFNVPNVRVICDLSRKTTFRCELI